MKKSITNLFKLKDDVKRLFYIFYQQYNYYNTEAVFL